MPAPTGAQGDAGQQNNGTPPAAAGTPAAAAGAGSGAAPAAPAAGASGEPDTQKAIDAIIARERSRAATELASLRTDYDRRIAELEARIPAPKGGSADPSTNASPDVNAAIEAARKPLQDELASERATRLKLEETTLTSMVQAAATGTVSPETVALLAKGQVRMTNGVAEVVDANGQPRYTANGPMTVKDLVTEIVAKNDFLVPASVRNGGNYRGTQPQQPTNVDEQIAQLESEGKHVEANRLKSQKLWSMPKPAAAAPAAR